MRFYISFFIVLSLLISFCNCYNISVSRDSYNIEGYKFVKNVIKDWNKKHKNDINEISIMNLNNDSSIFDVISKVIPKTNSILIPEKYCKDSIKYHEQRQSSLFIIVSKVMDMDQDDQVCKVKLFVVYIVNKIHQKTSSLK